jgi:hypothetical protein
LLGRNFYLTALELLVESTEHGAAQEFQDLQVGTYHYCLRASQVELTTYLAMQVFFNDADKFPARELAKYQNVNGALMP